MTKSNNFAEIRDKPTVGGYICPLFPLLTPLIVRCTTEFKSKVHISAEVHVVLDPDQII